MDLDVELIPVLKFFFEWNNNRPRRDRYILWGSGKFNIDTYEDAEEKLYDGYYEMARDAQPWNDENSDDNAVENDADELAYEMIEEDLEDGGILHIAMNIENLVHAFQDDDTQKKVGEIIEENKDFLNAFYNSPYMREKLGFWLEWNQRRAENEVLNLYHLGMLTDEGFESEYEDEIKTLAAQMARDNDGDESDFYDEALEQAMYDNAINMTVDNLVDYLQNNYSDDYNHFKNELMYDQFAEKWTEYLAMRRIVATELSLRQNGLPKDLARRFAHKTIYDEHCPPLEWEEDLEAPQELLGLAWTLGIRSGDFDEICDEAKKALTFHHEDWNPRAKIEQELAEYLELQAESERERRERQEKLRQQLFVEDQEDLRRLLSGRPKEDVNALPWIQKPSQKTTGRHFKLGSHEKQIRDDSFTRGLKRSRERRQQEEEERELGQREDERRRLQRADADVGLLAALRLQQQFDDE